jgi:hypothetical protein
VLHAKSGSVFVESTPGEATVYERPPAFVNSAADAYHRSESQEGVDLVTRIFETTYTEESVETILVNYHPDLVYHPRSEDPEPSTHLGRDAFGRLIRGYVEGLSVIAFDILEVIDRGGPGDRLDHPARPRERERS